ncbi:extracellular solute-binding protein [Paenibacillus psychroresistens]|uniref:Extracellular solute-binding protein n=1 Tax=Paenibacillus psychroresistens TaxID=1778678 RepID=A0A6B8RRI1_9BACL|nr:extracellular solute-binding protein [Paenibacillus psychroresistens]QGQ98093.1 extracellular solute-binding protein [Paenibacillus psychroresistens]
MKNYLSRSFILFTVFALVLVASGCGTKKTPEASTAATNASTATNAPAAEATPEATPEASKEPVTIKIYTGAADWAKETNIAQVAAFTAATGIKVEPEIVPGDGIDIYKKIDLDMSSGGTADVIPLANPLILDKYVMNDFLLPLNDMMKADNYDADKIYGKYLTKYKGDQIYSLPITASMWAVFYNKKIFDDAKVPYPPASWTWDQYIETAKKLTDKDKGIYGSYMLDYDIYMFMLSRQNNISGYKADGTSNYDDPIFKRSLQLFGDLGSVHKVQPNWIDFKTKKLPWDGFMSGKYGMHLIGTWYSGLLTNKKDYPIDWKWGVTQIPTDGTAGTNNFGVTFTNGVNKKSLHPKEALEYVKYMGENNAKMSGNVPALADANLQKDSLKKIADDSEGNVTVDDLSKAYFDNNLGYVQEKIIGPAATEYSNIILQEAELYLIGKRSLDDTVKAIKEKADAAIANEKK